MNLLFISNVAFAAKLCREIRKLLRTFQSFLSKQPAFLLSDLISSLSLMPKPKQIQNFPPHSQRLTVKREPALVLVGNLPCLTFE